MPNAPAPQQSGQASLLAKLLGGGGPAASSPTAQGALPATAPTTTDSGVPHSVSDSAQDSEEGGDEQADAKNKLGGLLGSLQGLIQFFSAKPSSASNDAAYQKTLVDAGIPADQTGVGK